MKTYLMSYCVYITFLINHSSTLDRLSEAFKSHVYFKAIFKMIQLNVDDIIPFMDPFYSPFGRPAKNQIQILRSFVLMHHFGYTSICKWANHVKNSTLLSLLCGFDPDDVSSFPSYYDFMDRFYLGKEDSHIRPAGYFSNKNKSRPRDGDKLENFDKNKTQQIVDSYSDNHVDELSEDAYLQMFHTLGVQFSVKNGLIDVSKPSVISGDGSALATHASSYGHHIKGDNENRRYSDIDADWGWDSDLNKYYFGYNEYNISIHNKDLHIDLPVFLTLTKASLHDAISCLTSLAKFMAINATIPVSCLCLDSASDNYATHRFAYSLGINPVIDINKRRTGQNIYEPYDHISENGRPVCQNKKEMVPYGRDMRRMRHKFRCPYYSDLENSDCPFKETCTHSSYGRVIYIKFDKDIKLFGAIRYKSDEWKDIYRNRTSCERINNRIINDYHIKDMKTHGRKRNLFMLLMIGINIHLDAYYKVTSL